MFAATSLSVQACMRVCQYALGVGGVCDCM